ncbi:hypothetical protein KVV02_008209 [Mortierella alpina]|uniref:Uncharacterized protein n=1 Tax=Mortierella alpina TaxID=64518 RepID=A0A9P8CWX6_MORAP|nr:hypothetical protein KVV02_008209 [Mortierella alpina]
MLRARTLASRFTSRATSTPPVSSLLRLHHPIRCPAMSSAPFTSGTSTSTSNASSTESQSPSPTTDQKKSPLALPAPGDVPTDAQQLEVNGKDIKLDILGPVVVNEDGTMSRIDNWGEMADIEKANVRRILLKRNAQRLTRLRAERDQAIADNT